MANNIATNNLYQHDDDVETEDGEIDDNSTADVKIKELEIENYYLSLNSLGCDLRCSCCGDVFSDPVKLQCRHLIDRSCAVIKKNGNVIECSFCRNNTICDDIDLLVTDFDVASRIPPKPETLIAIINKHGDHLMKREQRSRELCNEEECCSSDGGSSRPKKRKRKTRWDKIEDDVHRSFSGAIRDILSSHNEPKNITLSQFKKFTEISSKTSIMSLLTKAVMQSVHNGVNRRNAKIGAKYTDSEILEMIPSDELKDFFEVEKTQFMMLYRDALDRGVIVPSTQSQSIKPPLLPTPKPSFNDSAMPKKVSSHKSSCKKSFPESIEVACFDKSSESSFSDSDMSQGLDPADLTKQNKTKRTNLQISELMNAQTYTSAQDNPTIASPSSYKNDKYARRPKEKLSKGKHEKESASDAKHITESASGVKFRKNSFSGEKHSKRSLIDDKLTKEKVHREKYVKENAHDIKHVRNSESSKDHAKDGMHSANNTKKNIPDEKSMKEDLKRDRHVKKSVPTEKHSNESASNIKRKDDSALKHAKEDMSNTKHKKERLPDEKYTNENIVGEKRSIESLSSTKHEKENEPSAKHKKDSLYISVNSSNHIKESTIESRHTKESVSSIDCEDDTLLTEKNTKENLPDGKTLKESVPSVKHTKGSISDEKYIKEMGPIVNQEQREGQVSEDSTRYRESISRLHSIYSSMYEASLIMKKLENQQQSPDYQAAHKTYSENYTKYQKLYSSLQATTNLDPVVTEKSDPVGPSTVKTNRLVSAVSEEQASSTISPCNYAPDSTESINDSKTQNTISIQTLTNSTLKSDVPLSLSELRQHKKRAQTDYKKKFGYLWISNLGKETKTNDLCKLFAKFGHVSKIKLFQYKAQSPMTFFSLIFMPNIEEAEAAYRQLQNTSLLDRQINIKMLENNPLSDDRLL